MSTDRLPPETRWKQVPGHLVSQMNGETVMMSVEKGKYYNLGEVGGRIWQLLDQEQGATLSDIACALQGEYEVEPDVCERQVHAFLSQLLDEGLVRPGEAG